MKTASPVALLILMTVVSSCALHQAKGPLFSTTASPQPGKALIYIYRPPNERFGYQRVYHLQTNGNRLRDMKCGGYYPYEASLGRIQLIATTKQQILNAVEIAIDRATTDAAKLEFDVQAGRVYYVKLHPDTHPTYIRPQLFLMTDTDGESEIKACKLLSE